MPAIYHLVLKSVWGQAPDKPYTADSLASEGFIHCSYAGQVAQSANRFYADSQDLLVLRIDPAKLTSPLREEPSATGEVFPHIYGSINRDAVVAVHVLQRGSDGRWQFPG